MKPLPFPSSRRLLQNASAAVAVILLPHFAIPTVRAADARDAFKNLPSSFDGRSPKRRTESLSSVVLEPNGAGVKDDRVGGGVYMIAPAASASEKERANIVYLATRAAADKSDRSADWFIGWNRPEKRGKPPTIWETILVEELADGVDNGQFRLAFERVYMKAPRAGRLWVAINPPRVLFYEKQTHVKENVPPFAEFECKLDTPQSGGKPIVTFKRVDNGRPIVNDPTPSPVTPAGTAPQNPATPEVPPQSGGDDLPPLPILR